MQTRPMTLKDLEKIQALHRGEIHLPKWISDWDAKIEESMHLFAAAVSQDALTPAQQDQYIHAIVHMKFRKDHLYNKWLKDLPHKTWDELASERAPSREDLFHYTVEDTEDYLNGPDVSAFVLFLDGRWPGFLKKFVQACLKECNPLLEGHVSLTPKMRNVFSLSGEPFGTGNKDVVRTRAAEWIRDRMPQDVPAYVQRVFTANGLAVLGGSQDYLDALQQLEYARGEATDPEYAKLMKSGDPRIEVYIKQGQYWLIDVLLKLWSS